RSDFQEMLTQAAIEHQVVWMRYFTASRQETNERKVEPYILHLHPHGFHLIAYCLHREAFLRFNINLIQEARLLPQRFDAKSRCFDLKQFLSEGFDQHRSKPILDVHIRIKYPTAHWAKDQFYHTTQVIEERSDGVEIRFRSEGSEAIMARILSLGEDCEVLAPPSLRRKVQGKASNIRDLYPE
ncbi:MAG: WYL domain-containing protein, partial [Myxococcota bacterium]